MNNDRRTGLSAAMNYLHNGDMEKYITSRKSGSSLYDLLVFVCSTMLA